MSQRNDERRKYEGDVFYEAWRRGLNPDRATDCATDCFYDGRSPEQCVDGYEARERRRRQRREQEECPEEQYPEEWPRRRFVDRSERCE